MSISKFFNKFVEKNTQSMIQQEDVVQQPETIILFYDVFGRKCPPGMTCENCALRKELQERQAKYGVGDGFDGFGYRVMENGNLLVPIWYREPESEKGFSIKTSIKKQCYHNCFWDSMYREQKNPDDFNKQPQMQTVIYTYNKKSSMCLLDCCIDTCPLRKELADLEEKYEIGYRVLSPGVLLVPGSCYNRKNNLWFDIKKMADKVCWKCFLKHHARDK